ncbi:MAG: type II toxin-antitoxin system VapC family toxin [Candidatus Omnitrophota bacterium]
MFFLDTDTCVFILRGTSLKALSHLKDIPHGMVKLPAVVYAELSFGALKADTPSAQKAVEFFVSPFEIVPFDHNAAEIYGELRMGLEKKGKLIGSNDLMIAATAISRRAILITHNTKEFSRIQGLKLQDWTI